MAVSFTVARVLAVPTALIQGTISAPQPGIVSSKVTVTETFPNGTVGSPNTTTLTPSSPSFTFSAAVGSTLNATQVDTNAAGFDSPPAVVPPFPVADPSPAVPTGAAVVGFQVVSITP